MKLAETTIEIYQLNIWLKYVSPMIWRRLFVRSDSTIADLHHYIQIIMGCEDYHLNQFTIRQGCYGVYHDGGKSFSSDANKLYLKDFHFRINEKFIYEYNFYIPWECEIRIEKKLPFNVKQKYPLCIDGKNAAPLENCSSVEELIQLTNNNSPMNIELKLSDTLEEYSNGEINLEEFNDIINNLKESYNSFIFDKKNINEELEDYTKYNKNSGR